LARYHHIAGVQDTVFGLERAANDRLEASAGMGMAHDHKTGRHLDDHGHRGIVVVGVTERKI
jgi:hypothetical protein